MSRSQKVNEPETMSTASAYLYKEQAECVQQVHQYLVEHLDSRVTQAELAQRYHISLTSLKGAFKQVYGLPINTYLRRCRVQHAEQLLFTTDLSILEIAQRVGYDSAKKALPRGNAAACALTSCRKKKRLPDVELQRSKTHSSGGLKLGEMVKRGTWNFQK